MRFGAEFLLLIPSSARLVARSHRIAHRAYGMNHWNPRSRVPGVLAVEAVPLLDPALVHFPVVQRGAHPDHYRSDSDQDAEQVEQVGGQIHVGEQRGVEFVAGENRAGPTNRRCKVALLPDRSVKLRSFRNLIPIGNATVAAPLQAGRNPGCRRYRCGKHQQSCGIFGVWVRLVLRKSASIHE